MTDEPDDQQDQQDQHDLHDRLDENLVSIFKTGDSAILPLATMALESEGIEYQVRTFGKADSLRWMMSQSPTNRPEVSEIRVTSDVAARARDLLIDLEQQTPRLSPTDPGAIGEATDPPGLHLEDAATGIAIGTITEGQLQELTSHLEEDATPQQFFVDAQAIDVLRAAHADRELVEMLRLAVGDGDGLVIRWVVG